MLRIECLCSPPNSYGEVLIPNVVVFGGGVSGRKLSHEDKVLMRGISGLLSRKRIPLLSKKEVLYKLGIEFLPEPDHAGSHAPEL